MPLASAAKPNLRSANLPSHFPTLPQQSFLDSVGVVEVVQREVAEHDEDRVA